MAEIKIYGAGASNYVRTVRLACEEKGVAYDLVPVGDNTPGALKSVEHFARHPFGRIPVMEHGDFRLFESMAISRYIDEAFDGPALQPKDVAERARMTQWISATQDYLISSMIGGNVRHFVFPKTADGKPDMAAIEEGRPLVREHILILEKALEGRTVLAGDDVSLADLLLLPVLHYLGAMPGGMAFFEGCDNLYRWWEHMTCRPSFAATTPDNLRQEEQRAAS